MRNSSNRLLLWFISLVILVTLVIQVYWNFRNFEAGKQQLRNEVQISLDNALNAYYLDLAQRKAAALGQVEADTVSGKKAPEILLNHIPVSGEPASEKTAVIYSDTFFRTETDNPNLDSLLQLAKDGAVAKQKKALAGLFGSAEKDSLQRFMDLTSRIVVSITTDSLETQDLEAHLRAELLRKNIQLPFGYLFKKSDGTVQVLHREVLADAGLSTFASSAFLPRGSSLELFVGNTTPIILKRNLIGILISAALIAAVILCLFFLLRIINRQKQLAELRNDLLSNLTHEFKTPISTAKVALEGMSSFNKENDPEKTRRYLKISNEQLDRLQLMVEKLLETASLDGNQLQLRKEEVPLTGMILGLLERYKIQEGTENFQFTTDQQELLVLADPFHLENALNNVLDNAVKYGGNQIEVAISSDASQVKIRISDNGKSFSAAHSEQVFEKFYRVPKGNLHEVPGYGIGLYYTRNIIEKHGGKIRLDLKGQTNFIITLPKYG